MKSTRAHPSTQACVDEILRTYVIPKRDLDDIRSAQYKLESMPSGDSLRAV